MLNLKGTLHLALMGLLLALAACGEPSSTARPAGVEAKGKNAIAAGRDVVIDKNTVIKEYDTDKARKIEANRFARSMNRECTQYLEMVRALQLNREKGDHSDAMMPGIFSPIYAAPETQRLFGDRIYKELNSQQEELKSLRGAIFTMRNQYAMAAAFAMMAQYNPRSKSPDATNPAPTEEQFLAKKDELMRHTQSHCEYLTALAQ